MVLKIITSIYDLRYEDGRGGMRYKSFPLLTQTIQNLIFDEYEYVIYTDKHTYDTFSLGDVFNQQNVVIKIEELNSATLSVYILVAFAFFISNSAILSFSA